MKYELKIKSKRGGAVIPVPLILLALIVIFVFIYGSSPELAKTIIEALKELFGAVH